MSYKSKVLDAQFREIRLASEVEPLWLAAYQAAPRIPIQP